MSSRTAPRWLLLLTLVGVGLMHTLPVLALTPQPAAPLAVAGHTMAHAGHGVMPDMPAAPQSPDVPEHAQHALTHCTAVLPTGVPLPTADAVLSLGITATPGAENPVLVPLSSTTRGHDPPDLQQLCISRT